MNHSDYYDKLLKMPGMYILWPFYQRFREQILYLFFGGLTFFLSVFLFWLFTGPFSMNALSANVIVWIICVAFAYLTNRTWVFQDKAETLSGLIRECRAFVIGRLGTLLLEELILWIGIDLLRVDSMMVKIVAQVFVIVGNYIISKWLVFRKE